LLGKFPDLNKGIHLPHTITDLSHASQHREETHSTRKGRLPLLNPPLPDQIFIGERGIMTGYIMLWLVSFATDRLGARVALTHHVYSLPSSAAFLLG
jgi:hypothetical protein